MIRVPDAWLRKVLGVLYRHRRTTRAEIVHATQLNVASVSQTLQYLLSSGAVIKLGELNSRGGRRRHVLQLNPKAASFVSVDLEGPRIRFARSNLAGEICRRWEEEVESGQSLAVERIVAGVQIVSADSDSLGQAPPLAVGISHPGLIDKSGAITAVNLGWERFPLLEVLQKRIDLPLFLERDEQSCILAERWLGRAQNAENWVHLQVGSGVGVGMVIDGHHVRGNDQMAGELGHIAIAPDADDLCNCGRRGCLEAIASAPNIVRQYLEKTGNFDGHPVGSRVAEVFDLARHGDRAAREVVERAGRALGLAMSFVANLLSPELIVLGGEGLTGADLLLPLIRKEIDQHVLSPIAQKLTVTTSSLGLDIRLVGGAALAFRHALSDADLLHKLAGAPAPRIRPKPAN